MICREVSRVKRIPIGKTLELYVKICRDRLEDIIISGDFFAHPEEVIDEIENSLRGVEMEKATAVLESFRNKVVFTGFTYSDFVCFINEVLREVHGS